MNIVKELVARIEARAAETKSPCKTYATEAAAEKVAEKLVVEVAKYFTRNNPDNARPMRYLVVFVPSLGRWACGFDMTEMIARSSSSGGYLGICGDHFTF